MKKARVILDLCGKPVGDGNYLSTCHGYYAYVESDASGFIKEFFKSLSIWGSSTKSFRSIGYQYAYGYELNCHCKQFLMSEPFKIMCSRHNIELTICDDELEDKSWKETLQNFFNEYKN